MVYVCDALFYDRKHPLILDTSRHYLASLNIKKGSFPQARVKTWKPNSEPNYLNIERSQKEVKVTKKPKISEKLAYYTLARRTHKKWQLARLLRMHHFFANRLLIFMSLVKRIIKLIKISCWLAKKVTKNKKHFPSFNKVIWTLYYKLYRSLV